MPFENTRQDPRLTWMREGAAVLVTELLTAAGESVIDREERLRAFERLQLPASAILSRASSIKVGTALGATTVVIGSVELAGDQLTARARMIRLDTGRLMPEVQAQGPVVGSLRGLWTPLGRPGRACPRLRPPAIASRRHHKCSSST